MTPWDHDQIVQSNPSTAPWAKDPVVNGPAAGTATLPLAPDSNADLDPRIQGIMQGQGNMVPQDSQTMVESLKAQLASPLSKPAAPAPQVGPVRNFLGSAFNEMGRLADLPIRGLGELGIIDPTTAAEAIHTPLAPESPGLVSEAGHIVGGVGKAVMAGPLAPGVFAAEGAENAQEHTEQRMMAGEQIDESARLADVGGQAALGWVMGRLFGNNVSGGIAKGVEAQLAKRVPQLIARYGGRATAGALLGEGQQLAGNVITKGTIDPSQEITEGAGKAALLGGATEVGMGMAHDVMNRPASTAQPTPAPESSGTQAETPAQPPRQGTFMPPDVDVNATRQRMEQRFTDLEQQAQAPTTHEDAVKLLRTPEANATPEDQSLIEKIPVPEESPKAAPVEPESTPAHPEELNDSAAVQDWYAKRFGPKNSEAIGAMASMSEGKYVRRDVPIDKVKSASIMAGDTNSAKVENFSYQPAETAPPIIAIGKGDTLDVADGGHRLGAAKMRGDSTISAYVPEAWANKHLGEPSEVGGAHSSLSAAGAHDPFMDPRSGESSMKTLTEQVAKAAPAKAPLLRQIRAGASVGETLSKLPAWVNEKTAAIVHGYDRVKGGLAAMFNSYKAPPKNTTFDLATRRWSGADNISALEIERFRKSAEASVPEKVNRGAIALAIEAGGNQAKLQEWANKIAADPKLAKTYGPIFEAALKLSDDHKLIANSVAVRNEATLHESQKAGLLKDGVDNYLMHVWSDNPDMVKRLAAESNFNSLSPRPGFTKQRMIPTYFDGIMQGYTPRDLDFASLTAAHERSFREALAARDYLKTLSEGKASDGRPLSIVSPASAKEIVGEKNIDPAYLVKANQMAPEKYADYKVVDHPALRGWRWAGTDSAGKPIMVQGDMLIHPDAYRSLKNNLGKSGIQSFEVKVGDKTIRPGAAVMRISSELKHAILSFSLFHQTTLGVHAMEHRVSPNPLPAKMGGLPDINLENPIHKGLINHGLMVAHYNGAEAFGEGVAPGGLITKIPAVGPIYQQYANYLFKDYLPRVKMKMAEDAFKRNTIRFGSTMSRDQIMSMTADQANAAFGGLNYRALGRNKTFQDVLRLTLMAPDFLEARGRFVAQALTPQGKEQRKALVVGALAGYTAARLLNMLTDGDPHWDKPFTLVWGGKEYELRTIQGDLSHLVGDPAAFARNRLSPLSAFGVQTITGRNRFGQKTSTGEAALEAVKQEVPLPVKSLFQNPDDSTPERISEAVLKGVGINVRKQNTEALK